MSLLTTYDDFKTWRDKINGAFDEPTHSAFSYVVDESSALDVTINAGVYRNNVDYTTIIKTIVSLQANQTNVICVDTRIEGSEVIESFILGSVPDFCIPLFEFITNNTDVVSYTDLRSWGQTNTKANKTSVVVFADNSIDENMTIPAGKSAFSVSPTIAPGVTVTVEDGAYWAII